MSKNTLGKKAYVGMSGGVDSSVSAALLKEQGYDVTGVFIKVWQPDFMPCTWKEDRHDAMRVAAHLNIPFITLDLEKEYKREVVDYMIDEYRNGRTPNPDVMCNRHVKFGGFYDWAMKQGADVVATGHYARTEERSGKTFLLKGEDDNKDQSYFLWTLTTEKLSKVLFPVGNIEKAEVRRLAKKFKLPNADKKDSQGLCFMGKIDVKEFLKHYIDENPGDVLSESGEKLGTHDGALFFTLGERHGFTITKKTPNDAPYFIVAKNTEKNTITVSNKKPDNTDSRTISIKDTNWIGEIPQKNKTYQARVRYRGDLNDVKIEIKSPNEAKVEFLGKGDMVASGQSVVFYDHKTCQGGGIVL